MLTHTNKIKPFRCDQCPRAFYRPFDLNQHKLTHTKTRHHLCPHCDQTFGTSGGLKSHIGLHNGTRPFSCGLCELTFVNSSSASTHRRSHQIGNVYRCQKCGLEIQHFTRFKMHAEVCQSNPGWRRPFTFLKKFFFFLCCDMRQFVERIKIPFDLKIYHWFKELAKRILFIYSKLSPQQPLDFWQKGYRLSLKKFIAIGRSRLSMCWVHVFRRK